jgi:hypothetical protein
VGYIIDTSGKKRPENINRYETIKRSQSKSSPWNRLFLKSDSGELHLIAAQRMMYYDIFATD